MLGAFEGKTALVTGGARGLGRVVAKRLAASGVLVGFNYATSADLAAEVVAEIEADGGEVFCVQAPLGSKASTDAFVAAVEAELITRRGDAGLDILVNNIGGGTPSRFGSVTEEEFDAAFEQNVRVPFFLTQALMPRLRDGGRVVNISSSTVRVGFDGTMAYVMAKAALDKFSHLAAKTLGARGITVNSVAMGRTAGKTNSDFYANPDVLKTYTEATALKRIGTEDDVVGVVLALVSPEAGWITGQVVDASGGYRL